MTFRFRTLLNRSRFRYIFYSQALLFILGLFVFYYYFILPYSEDRLQNVSSTKRVGVLRDVLWAINAPEPGRSIFFIKTNCRLKPSLSSLHTIFSTCNKAPDQVNLTAHQACAIESAARLNPKLGIFVLFTSPVNSDSLAAHPLIEAILCYPNVNLRNINILTYVSGTPIYSWFKRGAVFRSRFVNEHYSNLLRYLTLYRWGGTYLDLDIILVQSIQHLLPNFALEHDNIVVTADVLNFAADGFGHNVAKMCLADFERYFNGNDLANNGPGVISRVVRRLCGSKDVLEMLNRNQCQDFRTFPRDVYYKINASSTNDYKKNELLQVSSNEVHKKLAKKHCPKVFAAAGEYF